jgi:tetratricopeptide (TPR) repeat protein
MRNWFLAALCFTSISFGADLQQDQARKLYERTDFQGSLQLLLLSPRKGADTLDLIGRNYYMLGEYKKASAFLLEAVAAEPDGSDHYLWLGRAFGRRAEHSSPLTAPSHAAKARQNFEKAVELNPRNLDAMSDLFEYYLEAPGFLGGGVDKAATLAKRIAALDPVEGHYTQYKLAEKKGDLARAEQELRHASAKAPDQPGRVIDLAKFLARQGRHAESDQLFHCAEKLSSNRPKSLFDRADTYIHAGRNLDMARELLKRYLAAELGPDDPPRHEAEKLLKQASRS